MAEERTVAGTRRAVFLDRDGTVMVEADYLADPAGVELIQGAATAIRRLKGAGFAVVLVSNQSGIARGLYDETDYQAVAARLREVLGSRGAAPDATYHCPHHPDFSGPCDCRKPATGMYRRAAAELGLDLAASYYVGDKPGDVEPALTLGGKGILVRTGYGRESEDRIPAGMPAVDDLAEAAERILQSLEGGLRGSATGRSREPREERSRSSRAAGTGS
ncbi:MAG TPA: HAD family hydrolase [Longimicrobiales bacterium]|nr:HAD family hydrolase [Longimicrobiales bacterium]